MKYWHSGVVVLINISEICNLPGKANYVEITCRIAHFHTLYSIFSYQPNSSISSLLMTDGQVLMLRPMTVLYLIY